MNPASKEVEVVRDPTSSIITSPAEMRTMARGGEWHGSTGGQCPAYEQANLVILPKDVAIEFAAFCTRNPKPCPLIEITPPGDPEPVRSAPGADLRTDLPGYRIYRWGELVEQREEILDVWRDDLVAFLLGCSLTFEHALIEAGISVRNVENGTLVPMYMSSLLCRPAGRFHGPIVVTMRPIPERQIQLAYDISAGYPHAHGSPLHAGSPETIGIVNLDRPDYGDPVAIHQDEVPVFWACGVTPQAVALETRPELMITHEPGIMFLTDLRRGGLPRLD
jgi:uncharacterized protein YcsI (UPF0317 family)